MISKVSDTARITEMWQRHEGSKGCWENGAKRPAWPRVATNLPFVKKKKKKRERESSICKLQILVKQGQLVHHIQQPSIGLTAQSSDAELPTMGQVTALLSTSASF